MHERKLLAAAAIITVAMVVSMAAVAPSASLAARRASAGSIPLGVAATGGPPILSSTPKTVLMDPTTGAVLEVTAGEPANIPDPTPDISSGTDCASGDGCYYTPTVEGVYHDRSFWGSPGTFDGSWPRRNAWDSGKYTARACWKGACSASWVGPNTYVTFGVSLVTGTSFSIR